MVGCAAERAVTQAPQKEKHAVFSGASEPIGTAILVRSGSESCPREASKDQWGDRAERKNDIETAESCRAGGRQLTGHKPEFRGRILLLTVAHLIRDKASSGPHTPCEIVEDLGRSETGMLLLEIRIQSINESRRSSMIRNTISNQRTIKTSYAFVDKRVRSSPSV